MLLETERLYLREMTAADRPALCRILQDAEVMYAYEHAFDGAEVDAWLEKQFFRYREHGFGLWAVLLKQSGDMIGQCGITMQDFNGVQVPEIGYLFAKAYWHRGYATEAALGCRKYAFEVLGLSEVYAIIRDSNLPSQNVARRCGMSVAGHLVKHYYGMDMPHTVFSVKREDGSALTRP